MLDSIPTPRLISVSIALTLVLLAPGAAPSVWAQTPDGEQVFKQSCASCHTGAPDSRAPSLDSLKARTPQAVIESLMTGAMRPQGSRLSGPERRVVAEFVTGKKVGFDVTGAETGRGAARVCVRASNVSGPHAPGRRGRGGVRQSPTPASSPREVAGLTAADVPRLALKWALRFPGCVGRVVVARRRGRPSLRRQSERHGLLARCEDGMHSLDLQRCGRRAHGYRRRPGRRQCRRR